MIEMLDDTPQSAATQHAVIKVVGVGNGGCNAIDTMKKSGIEGVELICANTDLQMLKRTQADQHIQLGRNLTRGLGAGGKPEIGKNAAEEDRQAIDELLEGTDMLFVTTGMGGGTGTGAIPVIAEIARSKGILTVAVVTRPFAYEGKKKMKIAEEGIRTLIESVDSLITIPNEKLLTILDEDVDMEGAFAKGNDVLLGAVRGISDIIQKTGLQNVDFADVKTMMSQMGMAVMGTGSASGPNRAREATEAAIHNPLLEDVNLQGARGILVNITGDFGPRDVKSVAEMLDTFSSEDADIKIGTVIDRSMQGELQVTVIVTGLDRPHVTAPAAHEATLALSSKNRPPLRSVPQASEQEAHPSPRAVQRPGSPSAAVDGDYLDIPAWLRNQSD